MLDDYEGDLITTQRWTVTDQDCLKQDKSLGKKVEFVDEAELGDTLRCLSTDTAVSREPRLGKTVEITD
ncbi:MAG: hypothetical protein ACT4OO_07810 [Nitrospiraceae bacterium]